MISAAMRSVVITSLRINGSEMFMEEYLFPPPRVGEENVGLPLLRLAAVCDRHGVTRNHAQLTLQDHRVAGFDIAGDDGACSVIIEFGHIAHVRNVVARHDVDIVA